MRPTTQPMLEHSRTILLLVTLSLTQAVNAERGNSIIYEDAEKGSSLAIDRVQLATLGESQRSHAHARLAEEHGQGRIGNPGSMGITHVLDRQDKASGSLRGKTLDVEFLPLDHQARIKKARAKKEPANHGLMEPLDDAGTEEHRFYYVDAGTYNGVPRTSRDGSHNQLALFINNTTETNTHIFEGSQLRDGYIPMLMQSNSFKSPSVTREFPLGKKK